jgi:hypothetical protein
VSSYAAQPPALSRWRRGHIHFSPAVRPLLQADRPEWSVASDAEGGSGERRGPFETHRTADIVDEELGHYLADLERARPPRPSPDPASTESNEARSVGRGASSDRGLSHRDQKEQINSRVICGCSRNSTQHPEYLKMPDESEAVTEETDLLLTHRVSRLEDLANNSLELIKINLLVPRWWYLKNWRSYQLYIWCRRDLRVGSWSVYLHLCFPKNAIQFYRSILPS